MRQTPRLWSASTLVLSMRTALRKYISAYILDKSVPNKLICIHTYIRTYVYIHTCIHTYACIHTYMRIYIHSYVWYIHIYIRMYIHTYVYIYTHVHVCIHIYIHTYVFKAIFKIFLYSFMSFDLGYIESHQQFQCDIYLTYLIHVSQF
jgi:hypothetical protein